MGNVETYVVVEVEVDSSFGGNAGTHVRLQREEKVQIDVPMIL